MKLDGKGAILTYTSGYHQDINVSNLAGVDVYGVIGVCILGSRASVGFGVTSGTAATYTISVTVYNSTTGAPEPSVNYNIYIYYLRLR